jgi:hypothetical protein
MAYDLDGTSSYLSLASAPVNTLPLTMAAWFNPDSVSVDGTIMCLANSAGNERLSMKAAGAVAGVPVAAEARSAANAANSANTSTSYTASTWQHAVAVYASTTSRTSYLNGGGGVESTTSIAFANGVNRLAIGARLAAGTPGTYLDGRIGEAGLWNVALDLDEIAALAKGLSPLLIRPNSLMFYAPLVRGLTNVRSATLLTSNGSPAVADHSPILMPRRPIIGQPAIVSYSMPAGAGSVSVSGQSAALKTTRIMAAAASSISVSGQAVSFVTGARISADAANFAVSGQTAALRATRKLTASASSFALSPQDATFYAHVPGYGLTILPSTPSVRFHPQYSNVTLGGDGRVLSISDLMGLANATAGAGQGPTLGIDAYGRKYLDFNPIPEGTGTFWLTIATALASLSSRSTTVFAVGRFFSHPVGSILSMGINGSSPPSMGGSLAQITGLGNGNQNRPYIAGQTAGSSSTRIGTQLQVVGWSGRSLAQGGVRVFLNRNARSPTTPAELAAFTTNGAEIGRDANSPAGSYLNAHIYELIIYQGFDPDNATVDAIATALADGRAIPNLTHDVVVEGDSISAGVNDRGISRWLSEPGMSYAVPATTRVNMSARSGSGFTKTTTQDPTYRRDLAGGSLAAQFFLSGDVPELTIQIGRNDITSDATADAAYNELVAYLYTTTTGVLQRGFKVVVGANIAEGSTLGITSSVLRLRNKILASQFLTDVHANTGQTYEGKVKIANLAAITSGVKGTVFSDLTDTTDTDIYQADGLHPTIVGELLEVSGGDTPQYGYRSNLSGGYFLTADASSFTVNGQAVSLRLAHRLVASASSFALAAQNAALSSGKIMPASTSAIAVAGQAAALRIARRLGAAASTVSVTGQAASLAKSSGTNPAPGAFFSFF